MTSIMASKVQSHLINKSSAAPKVVKAAIKPTLALDDLLSQLPSAADLQKESSSAPAAEQRRREQEERQAGRGERIERTRALRDSYAVYLIKKFIAQLAEAREKGYGWITVEKCYPPSKEEDKATGELVYVHEALDTHWAGVDEHDELINPEEGGAAPKVMLLQGPKPRKADASGRRDPNPRELPDGKTSVCVMKEELADRNYDVQTTYAKGMVNVVVIWDHDEWRISQAQHQKQRAQRTQEYRRDREESSGQITYEEYKAQTAARKKAVRAPPSL